VETAGVSDDRIFQSQKNKTLTKVARSKIGGPANVQAANADLDDRHRNSQ
jgi:hypothetical protein